ncbi:hypothetical protein D3C84_1137610 [compost metagenome]
MIIDWQIKPFQDRDDFFTAHVERFGIFVYAKLIFIVIFAVRLFSQYCPPPNMSLTDQ